MPVRYGLIEPEDLALPHLPEALDGVRIAHLSDFHVSERTRRLDRLANQLTTLRLDLVFFTGDYMDKPGDEGVTVQVMELLCEKLRPSLGSFGVFGNHDTHELRERLGSLPVHWLGNSAHRLPGRPIELLGLNCLGHEEPDAVALALDMAEKGVGDDEAKDAVAAVAGDRPAAVSPAMPGVPGAPRKAASRPSASAAKAAWSRAIRLMLCHYPSSITTAADLGVDAMFSGHTHGGQVRLPTGHAITNQCDLPLRLSAGVVRHRDTLLAISRGVGETGWPRQRVFCPPQVPVYTLRRRSMPGRSVDTIELLRAW